MPEPVQYGILSRPCCTSLRDFPPRSFSVFVCASTDCFPDLPQDEVLPTLVDLEFTAVELPIREEGRTWCRPSQAAESPEHALELFRDTHRLTIAALTVEPTGPKDVYYAQFAA